METIKFDEMLALNKARKLKLSPIGKAESFVILKADAPSGDRPHKAYQRTVKGKAQQIKQKGAPGKKDKGESKGGSAKGESNGGSTQVGHVIMVGQEPVKVTAVGKDGVTATDDKGNKHLIRHTNVEKKEGEEKKGGMPSAREHLEWLKNLKPKDEKSKEVLDSAIKIAEKTSDKGNGKEGNGNDDDTEVKKQTSFKKEEKKDHPVIDEFKSQYLEGGKKLEKTWMVPDPKVDGVYLIFTREKSKDSPYKAHIFYRADKDFETIDDVASAIKKHGPDNLKEEFDKKSEKKAPPGNSKEAKKTSLQDKINSAAKREISRLEAAHEKETNTEKKDKLKSEISAWKKKIVDEGEKTESDSVNKKHKYVGYGNLTKSIDQFVIISDEAREEFQKAQVKGYTRTRRGKFERVDPFSRQGDKRKTMKDRGSSKETRMKNVGLADQEKQLRSQQTKLHNVEVGIAYLKERAKKEGPVKRAETEKEISNWNSMKEDQERKVSKPTQASYRRIQSIANAIYDNYEISPLHKKDATVQRHAKRLAAAGKTAAQVKRMTSREMLTAHLKKE